MCIQQSTINANLLACIYILKQSPHACKFIKFIQFRTPPLTSAPLNQISAQGALIKRTFLHHVNYNLYQTPASPRARGLLSQRVSLSDQSQVVGGHLARWVDCWNQETFLEYDLDRRECGRIGGP